LRYLAQKRLDREEAERAKKSKLQSYTDENDGQDIEETNSNDETKYKNKNRYFVQLCYLSWIPG